MSSQFLNFSDFSPFLAAWFVPRTAFSLSLSAFVLLLSWRVWKFSIVPALYPNDPKEFPYWVPCKWAIKSRKMRRKLTCGLYSFRYESKMHSLQRYRRLTKLRINKSGLTNYRSLHRFLQKFT